MDKIVLKRHDILLLSEIQEKKFLKNANIYPSHDALPIVHSFFTSMKEKIPFVIRRSDEPEKSDVVAVGVSLPKRYKGARIRVSGYIPIEYIRQIITPFEIGLSPTALTTTKQVVAQFSEIAKRWNVQVGFFGSIGMEVVTGSVYRDQQSDIDILVRGRERESVLGFIKECKAFGSLGHLDGEVILKNGYGIKIQELMSSSPYLLGKSLTDVTVFARKRVYELIGV